VTGTGDAVASSTTMTDADGLAVGSVEPEGSALGVGSVGVGLGSDGSGLGLGSVGDTLGLGSDGEAEGVGLGSDGDGDGLGSDGEGDGVGLGSGVGVAGTEVSGVDCGELGRVGSGDGSADCVGSAGMGEAEPPRPVPLTGPEVDPVPAPAPPVEPSENGFGAAVPWAVTVDPAPDGAPMATASEDLVPAGRRARDSGRSGSDGTAATIAIGASWDSGSFRRRSTSDAVSTRTGASATTSRTAETAARPTAAAPAAMAAQAVIDSQRYLMTPVCPFVHLIPD
jgi:hypothetical protein